MLYQMLTGKIPRGLAKQVSELVPGIDPRFDAITDKAMQDEPARRYQSAKEFRQALLDRLSSELPVQTPDGDRTKSAVPAQAASLRPGSGGRRVAPSARKKPPVLAIVIGAVAAAGVAAVLVLSAGTKTGKTSTGVEVVHASSEAGSSLPGPACPHRKASASNRGAKTGASVASPRRPSQVRFRGSGARFSQDPRSGRAGSCARLPSGTGEASSEQAGIH